MGPTRSALLAAASLVVAACPSGTLAGPGDACVGPGCDGGCEGGCDGDADGGFDPCDSIVCPSGQRCVDGRCRSEDPCEGVRCDNPGEVCDRRDGACHPGGADDDGDGSTIAEGDCDDGDPSVHPGAAETCDGVDEDCDLEVDEGFPDADGDGFDTCGFGRPEQADCDDADAMSRPGGREQCDGRDNDCDGAVDEGLLARPCATACGEGEERCEGGRWSPCSAPAECECAPAGRVEAEPCGRCGTRSRTCGADLAWSDWGACGGETGECLPGEVQVRPCGSCGEQSRTCGATCLYPASWGDCLGEGACPAGGSAPCTTSCGSAGARPCLADCTWGGCAPPAESCNGVDDDCDGACDEGCRHGVHRSYSSAATDHLHSTSATEAACCGYAIERLNDFYLSTTTVPGTTPLYRCYGSSAGDHMVTTSSTCEGAPGWVFEGSLGSIATSATCGAVPLYRLGSGTDHFVTLSESERDGAAAGGYVYEGITGYAWTSP